MNPKWACVSACVSAWAMGVALATTMMACGEGMAAPLGRPAKTTEAPAATVLHVQGTVTVKPTAGATFPARVGHELVRSDRLEPAEGAFTVLLLTNGHAVRIDDTGALAVNDILLLNAPPSNLDVGTQVASLLDPGEKLGVPDKTVRERAAAWRHMIRAGDTAGTVADDSVTSQKAEAASEASEAAPRRGKAIESTGPAAGGRAAAPTPPGAPPPPAKESISSNEARKPNDVAADKTSRKDARQESPSGGLALVDEDPPATAAPPPPPLLVRHGSTLAKARSSSAPSTALPASLGDGQSLRSCVDGVIASTTAVPGAVELLLQIKGGTVVRVRLSGALPVPTCAQNLRAKSVPVADGWMVLTVPQP